MKIAIYVRENSHRAGDEASTADQVNRLTDWASQEGHEVVAVLREPPAPPAGVASLTD
jgi:hypothetical protein